MWRRYFLTILLRGAKQVLTAIVTLVAILYFAVDAVFLYIIRPFAARLSLSPLFVLLAARFARLGAYPTLALFLVPVVVLEPIKPIGFYLMGSGHVMIGVLIIAVGEILKVTLVERLFHISRDKLMAIRAFAWGYEIVERLLAVLRSQTAWKLVVKKVGVVKSIAHRLHLMARRPRAIPPRATDLVLPEHSPPAPAARPVETRRRSAGD